MTETFDIAAAISVISVLWIIMSKRNDIAQQL
jgi:hypothetical protein